MKRTLLTLSILISFCASAQTPSGSKVRYQGSWFLCKDTSTLTSADTASIVYQCKDSSFYARGLGYWRKIATVTGSGFVQYSDTATMLSNRLKISDTLTMLNGRLSSIILNNTGILHTTPLVFVKVGGTWTGTQTLATQSAYKLFGTGSGTATPTFRYIDSNYFNNQFAVQVRNVTGSSYLQISDTSTMLTNYLRRTDTASMLSGYSRTGNLSIANWNTAYTSRIVTTIAPLGLAANILSITPATTSQNGYLSSTDWNTFNNKVSYTDALARASLSFAPGSGAYNSTTGVITIPTNNNQITNGAGYLTGNQSITFSPTGDITGSTTGTTALAPVLTIGTGRVTNSMLANSTISGVSLGSNLANLTATDATLTFSGTYNGSAARSIGLNLGNLNTWTANQTFPNAIANKFSSSVSTTDNQLYTGSIGIQSFALNNGWIGDNLVYNGGFKTVSTGLSQQIYFNNGSHTFYVGNNSVGAGGTASLVQALNLAVTTGAATFSSSVTATSLIKSGGTSSQYLMADGSVTTTATAIGGVFTPTLTNTANVASSALANGYCTYSQNNNIVTVGYSITVTPTLSATLTTMTITLPVTASSSVIPQNYVGSATAYQGATTTTSGVNTIGTTTTATVGFFSISAVAYQLCGTFQYRVN